MAVCERLSPAGSFSLCWKWGITSSLSLSLWPAVTVQLYVWTTYYAQCTADSSILMAAWQLWYWLLA